MEATHYVIPDAQITPDCDTEFVEWIGRYIVDTGAKHPERNTTIIQVGDWWDMHSLSWYDRGKKSGEATRVSADEQAGIDAFQRLDEPLQVFNAGRRKKWKPRRIHKRGNHEERADRYANDNPFLDKVGMQYLLVPDGWEADEVFNEVTLVDGVAYAHYFYDPNTGRPYGGKSIDTRLKTVGHSFTQGHQQGLMYGTRATVFGPQHGLVAGSCYPRQPVYLGPQSAHHWRGIVVCHGVNEGDYNIKVVGLDYLCRRYSKGNLSLEQWKRERGVV